MNALNAEIARRGLSIPKLADMLSISRKRLYSRINGETEFKQPEIVRISKALGLSNEEILSIFFNDFVS